jgi:A/G-specific adenine glycosylase
MRVKTEQIVSDLLDWFSCNARDLPWRRTRDPYAIHVSEIMLQQTQVKTVIPYWERWLRELPTIQATATADPDKLHKLWEGLGYYTRVRNLQRASQVIVAEHGGRFPERFEDVLALPGIGRYTAGAICSIAFNQPRPILDGNVIRVLTRIFGIGESPKEKATNQRLWKLAEDLVVAAAKSEAENACSHLNQALMELGALVCTPRQAQCGVCPLRKRCMARAENRVEALPNLGDRPTATARRFAAMVIEREGKFLVRQRPAGMVNAHLWEFPNVELDGHAADAQTEFRRAFGVTSDLKPMLTIRHSITRYRITLEVFRAELGSGSVRAEGAIWKSRAQMERLAFTSAHRKILVALNPRRARE